ncbi:MAG: hypothetical protein AAF512_19470 [Pseudomonadota bacterium]
MVFEEIHRKLRYIGFDENELTELLSEVVLEKYFEIGGIDISIICLNYRGEQIAYNPDYITERFNPSDILPVLRENHLDKFQIHKDGQLLYGVSEDSGRSWVLGSGDKHQFIEEFIDLLWCRVFEM